MTPCGPRFARATSPKGGDSTNADEDPPPLGEVAAQGADGEGAEPQPSAYDHAAPADVLAIINQVHASADEEERYAARLDRRTLGYIWPFAQNDV